MNLEQFKNSIEQGSVSEQMVIFVYEDEPFVADQYIREISRIRNNSVQYLESIDNIAGNVNDIFGLSEVDDGIRVYKTKEIEKLSEKLKYETNLYIIVNKLKDKDTLALFDEYIIYIPKLEGWQLQDYLYSVAEGVPQKSLDWLMTSCNNDIYRIENELDKFRLFEKNEQKYLFNDMLHEGAFSDLSSFNVFNITNAVTSKDYAMLTNALKEIKIFDAEPLGVITLLYQGFRKLIQVWLAKQATPESTGLKSNVIYALSKQPRVYDKQQLLKSFQLLNDIDKQLKTGNIDTKWLIDYVVCRVLTY